MVRWYYLWCVFHPVVRRWTPISACYKDEKHSTYICAHICFHNFRCLFTCRRAYMKSAFVYLCVGACFCVCLACVHLRACLSVWLATFCFCRCTCLTVPGCNQFVFTAGTSRSSLPGGKILSGTFTQCEWPILYAPSRKGRPMYS